jgi:hypothetical protein
VEGVVVIAVLQPLLVEPEVQGAALQEETAFLVK